MNKKYCGDQNPKKWINNHTSQSNQHKLQESVLISVLILITKKHLQKDTNFRKRSLKF